MSESQQSEIKKLDQTESKDLTKEEEWRPTAHMIVWIDTAIEMQSDNVTDISEKCKITRASWYNWIKDDKFIAWYRSEWDKRLQMHGPRLDLIGLKQAAKDYKFWEAMQKRVGNIKEQGNTNIQVNVIPILGEKETVYVQENNSNQEDTTA